MPQLLKIDASSRATGSHSRELADAFLTEWRKANPSGRVVTRDLVADPLPHISGITIEGFYTPEAQRDARLKQALALSDRLIAELRTSDTILISSPIYNFSVPSALKAYIDHVSRIGETFAFDGSNFEGLVRGKRVYFALAYGLPATPATDMLRPYLQLLFGFLGMTEINFITVEGTVTDAATQVKAAAAANAIRAVHAAI
jgi:FMN-dependent NADH-azoreductase